MLPKVKVFMNLVFRVQAGGVHLSHGHVHQRGTLRLSHPQGRPLGHLQRREGGTVREPTTGPGLPLPVPENLDSRERRGSYRPWKGGNVVELEIEISRA